MADAKHLYRFEIRSVQVSIQREDGTARIECLTIEGDAVVLEMRLSVLEQAQSRIDEATEREPKPLWKSSDPHG